MNCGGNWNIPEGVATIEGERRFPPLPNPQSADIEERRRDTIEIL
jgi:hypothetical protein